MLSALCSNAFALNPALDISQYAHAVWTVRDGLREMATMAVSLPVVANIERDALPNRRLASAIAMPGGIVAGHHDNGHLWKPKEAVQGCARRFMV